jgi:hypothetical protein
MLLRGDIELAEEGAAVRPRDPGLRVDLDPAHLGQVHEEATVGSREPRGAVTARLDHDLEVVLASELDRRRDPCGRRRAHYDGRPAIVDRIPEPARIVVPRIGRRHDLAARPAQLVQVVGRDPGGCLDHLSTLLGGPWERLPCHGR